MGKFDIDIFNKLINGSDIDALEYTKNTILQTYTKDQIKLTKYDFLIELYYAAISLNSAVSTVEQFPNYTILGDINIFDDYTRIRDLYFKEIGITYKNNKYVYKKVKEGK